MNSKRHTFRAFPAALAILGLVACEADAPTDDSATEFDDSTNAPLEREIIAPREILDTDCIYERSDFRGGFLLEYGLYGSWAPCASMCPADSWVTDISVVAEASQGSGDDTGLNAIVFGCRTRKGNIRAKLISLTGLWGTQSPWKWHGTFDPLVKMNRMFEESQGSGDDTTLNRVSARTRSGVLLSPVVPGQTNYGSWLEEEVGCPSGQAICGLQTRVEASQGSGDDTALNGVALLCCSL